MPNENTQNLPPRSHWGLAVNSCELCEIMRRNLDCIEPTECLRAFGWAKQQLIGFGLLKNVWCAVSVMCCLGFSAPVFRSGRAFTMPNNKSSCVCFSYVVQETLTLKREHEPQSSNCVSGGKFQDFGYLTKILSLGSFPTWCQNSRRVNV